MLIMMLRDLRLAPIRTALTAVSMLIGVLAVVGASLVGTIGSTFLEATNAQIAGRPASYLVSVEAPKGLDADQMQAFATALADADGVAMAPVVTLSEGLTIVPSDGGGTIIPSTVSETVLTTSRYRDVYLLPLVSGQWFSAESDAAGLQIVVNEAGQNRYGGVGSTLSLTSQGTQTVTSATVTGVINDADDSPRVYINATSFAMFETQLWEPQSVDVYAHPQSSGSTANDISSLVSDIAYDSFSGSATGVQRIDNSDSYTEVLSYLQTAFAACAALLLAMAALGLLNIGLSDIEQRSHELLIRRALGASRTHVMLLVSGSSVILSLIVAAVAITLSMAFVAFIPSILPADSPIPHPSYPYDAAGYALAGAVVTALLGSAVPAVKAARLEPAMALR
ncbi:ABC transporter permease [Bifidobacterium eulemuris]|uniref:ABC transporter permease n=2 Tax=Bifidobacterium eulemuris TaxID=1765219 RepID=A0A261GAI5_9BIFI|nr:ABC transporter permease [Bifidobacterium eulemuris]OZG68195.1 macrolide ABC transporter ATP-binding protein [Bifidobacterium eulemuris]QOL31748.1 ABC transporter permease [Bifidobacterium eulemuris]